MPEERRLVTVLFADVAGSTAFGESADPEDVRAVLGRYYAIARDVIGAHGGTVEKFIGDAVMAVFGLPSAHGDDPERALAAALALRAAVAQAPETAELRLRMGVNTGEVVATRDSDAGDFLITGDAVNVAARLQQHAEPGAILVGARTRAATMRAFSFSAERGLSVKGKSALLLASELEAKLAERGTIHGAPFVGRDADLAQLELVARRAFAERRPQLVTITAPAGTGKSRLVEEFVNRLAPGALVATAQCLPYGSSVTYLPLRRLARVLLGVESDAAVQQRAIEALQAGGYPASDADRIGALVAATLGEREIEERDRDQLFGAWRVLIETLASRAPLIVVFEDLHWASDSLIDLVEHVTMPRTSAPLLMVALARPELLDRRPSWGGGRRNFTAIGLDPLSLDETRRLVEVLTEGVPVAMASRIAERAGGNPFFAGELVRAYEERKRAGATDEDIVLPDTVHATVLARLDNLPERERAVLEYGAVAGRTVRPGAIAALLSLPPDEIESALGSLAERGLLGLGTDGYTFSHIVIREVAYATLSRAERVRAHVRLAAWLETESARSGEEQSELVAYHYRQAIALTPGARLPGGVALDRVVGALERAARVAWNAGAFEEAAVQLREAIRLSPPEDHGRLYELLGDVVRFGNVAAAGYHSAFERWRERPAEARDPHVGARLLVKETMVYGRWAGSVRRLPSEASVNALLAEAEPLVSATGDPALAGKLAAAKAFRLTDLAGGAEPVDTADLAEQVRAGALYFADRGDRNAESEMLDALGVIHRRLGRWEEALDVDRARLRHAGALDLLERVDAASMLTWDLACIGRYADALEAYRTARREQRVGDPQVALNHAMAWAAVAASVNGRWDDCLELCDELRQVWEDSLRTSAVGRQTIRGFASGLGVAIARLDATRAATYRSGLVAIAGLAELAPDHWYHAYVPAIVDRRPDLVARAVATVTPANGEAMGTLLGVALFEAECEIDDATIDRIAAMFYRMPVMLETRLRLARALRGTTDELRGAIARAATDGMVSDAARAATLLALRTGEHAVRRDAEERLTMLGDRLYLEKLQGGRP